jgi:hypothetical protein
MAVQARRRRRRTPPTPPSRPRIRFPDVAGHHGNPLQVEWAIAAQKQLNDYMDRAPSTTRRAPRSRSHHAHQSGSGSRDFRRQPVDPSIPGAAIYRWDIHEGGIHLFATRQVEYVTRTPARSGWC